MRRCSRARAVKKKLVKVLATRSEQRQPVSHVSIERPLSQSLKPTAHCNQSTLILIEWPARLLAFDEKGSRNWSLDHTCDRAIWSTVHIYRAQVSRISAWLKCPLENWTTVADKIYGAGLSENNLRTGTGSEWAENYCWVGARRRPKIANANRLKHGKRWVARLELK